MKVNVNWLNRNVPFLGTMIGDMQPRQGVLLSVLEGSKAVSKETVKNSVRTVRRGPLDGPNFSSAPAGNGITTQMAVEAASYTFCVDRGSYIALMERCPSRGYISISITIHPDDMLQYSTKFIPEFKNFLIAQKNENEDNKRA